jgi:hypothetical protein
METVAGAIGPILISIEVAEAFHRGAGDRNTAEQRQ